MRRLVCRAYLSDFYEQFTFYLEALFLPSSLKIAAFFTHSYDLISVKI
jgi:hypothetical protein